MKKTLREKEMKAAYDAGQYRGFSCSFEDWLAEWEACDKEKYWANPPPTTGYLYDPIKMETSNMAAKEICDGCGKEAPTDAQRNDWFSRRVMKDGRLQWIRACSLPCVEKIDAEWIKEIPAKKLTGGAAAFK